MDPTVRAMSTRSDGFTLDEHRKWWDLCFNDRDTRIWVGEQDGTPTGQIRYSRGVGGIEIAISIDKRSRGQGHARELLLGTEDLAREALGHARLVALVLPANAPSMRLFVGCGFHLVGEEYRADKNHLRYEKS